MKDLMQRSGILFCLVGPAGAGKSTLAAHLLKTFTSAKLSVSVTSRAARAGEVQGRDYFFVSRAEFERKIALNEFFEWEEVHGNLYGTLKTTLEESIGSAIDLVLDIDFKGAFNLKRAYPKQTVIVFAIPPSFAELKNRVYARGSVSDQEFAKRVATARSEYEAVLADYMSGQNKNSAGLIDYILVNAEIKEASELVQSIFVAERAKVTRISELTLRNLLTIP